MAPADRNPNRRASLMPASDSETSRDDGFEPTTVAPMPRSAERSATPHDELTRRVDLSDNPGFSEGWFAEARKPARADSSHRDPRRTDIYQEGKADKPDVIGAPERTVIAPLPRRHEEVEPIPDAASTSGARVAAEVEARRQRRADEEARRRDEAARRDAQRRDARRERPESRETDRDIDVEPSRVSPAKERTTPAAQVLHEPDTARERESERPRDRNRDRSPRSNRDNGRSRSAARPEGTDHGLVHQPTAIDRAADDSPWARLGVALRDVSRAIVSSTKESWYVLRRQGVKPFLLRMKPGAIRVWEKTRNFAIRIRIVAVTKAVELGLVKPKRLGEYEQHGDDKLDHSRVEAWRRFNKGKTSSSYLQDDE